MISHAYYFQCSDSITVSPGVHMINAQRYLVVGICYILHKMAVFYCLGCFHTHCVYLYKKLSIQRTHPQQERLKNYLLCDAYFFIIITYILFECAPRIILHRTSRHWTKIEFLLLPTNFINAN